MDTFDILLAAIDQYAEKSAEYKKARAVDAAVYGQGYFSTRESRAHDEAKKHLRDALNGHVRHLVANSIGLR
jgi:hypothetical protein